MKKAAIFFLCVVSNFSLGEEMQQSDVKSKTEELTLEKDACYNSIVTFSSEIISEIEVIRKEKETRAKELLNKQKQGLGDDELVILQALYDSHLAPAIEMHDEFKRMFSSWPSAYKSFSEKNDDVKCGIDTYPKEETLQRYREVWDFIIDSLSKA